MNDALTWNANWAWSLPLIVVNVIYHVIGLAFIRERVVRRAAALKNKRNFIFGFALVMGTATLLAILLHALEAGIWAWVYYILGALPDGKAALLYSLSAITTYGHENFFLADHWRLMGALEALNGMILFGLTTAFLYSIIGEVWPRVRRAEPV